MEWSGSETWLLLTALFSILTLSVSSILWAMKRGGPNAQNATNNGDEIGVLPKGTSGWPFIGETLDFIATGYSSKPVSFMEKRKALYGNVFRTHILGKSVIVSTDPEVNKYILQNQGNVFIPSYPKSVNEIFGEASVLKMSGSLHKRVHGLISGFLKSPHFKERITGHIENAVRATLSTWTDKNCYVYVQHETKKLTFEVLVRSLLGLSPGEDMDLLKKEFEEYVKGIVSIPIKLPGTQLYKSMKAKKKLLQMVSKIIDERKTTMEKAQEKGLPNDALDVLLRASEELKEMLNHKVPPHFISGNIVELIIPGEESVPSSMTVAVKFLSDHPVALAHLVEENMELKRRKQEYSEEYSWSDYLSLPFTQNVISETLRLANIINAVWREPIKDVKIKGYLLPKGWCVLASLSSVHMNGEIYENPYEFDPWRWKENAVLASSNLFTAFGGGQRLCPGFELSRLEIAIFLHHLVTTYRWSAEKDEIAYFPTVRMKKKLPITVTPLQQ